MLVAMKKVDPDLLDELRDYFERLDVSNTGILSRDDLIEMARRKTKSPKRKLELYAYKQHLLNVSHRAGHRERKQHRLSQWFEQSLGFLGFSARHAPLMDDVQPARLHGLPRRMTPA